MEKITKSTDTVLIDPNEPLILPDGTALVGRIEWFLYALCCLDYQNLPTPMSRIEEFANALITGEIPNIEPQSRAEQFFLAILDGNVSNLPQPQSRSEILLDKLARGEFDLSDVEPIQSSYELLLAYLIKNGGIGNIDYVLYEFSEAMKTMYNTVEKPFKSLELSGNTLVNCVLEDTENDDYTSFDKDYSGTSFTINGTSEGAIKSAILTGQTLINLMTNYKNESLIEYNQPLVNPDVANISMMKPNTVYTLLYKAKYQEEGNTGKLVICTTDDSDKWITTSSNLTTSYAQYAFKFSTLSDVNCFVLRSNGHYFHIKECILLEGDHTHGDIPYFDGIQSVKMPVLMTTGKNLFNGEWELGSIHPETGGDVGNKNCIRTKDFFVVESNKEYTISNNKGYTVTSIFYDYAKNLISTSSAKTFITPSNSYFVKFRTSPSKFENDISIKFQIEQGSISTSYEPYKSNILTTIGKNLFDMNRPYDAITDSQATVVQDTNQITVSSAESGIYVNANFILDKDFFAGKTVTGSCLYESDEKDIGTVQIHYQDGNGEHHYQWIRTPRTFTFPNSFIGDVMLCVSANNTGTPQSNTVTVKNIQLELGSTATSYEPYSQGVTLRGIGDVKDELNLLTGEVTQNIYQITLTGDESGYGYSTAPSVDTDFHGTLNIRSANLPLNKKLVAPISDRFQGALYGANKTWQCCIGGSYALHFFIPKTELETSDINGFKNWVKQQYLNGNPIKVAYILEEKSIKTVDLNVVDQNNIKIDKIHVFDGTTHVNASSDELTPTVNIGKSVSYPTIIKPNTKYTVDLKRNDKPLTVNLGGTEVTFVDGETRKVITTPSTLTNDKLSYYGVGAKCNEIMLIEGEVEGNVDYFTGMQSVVMQNQMPILHTVGKNLFNINGYSTKNQYTSINGNIITVNAPTTFSNTVYTLIGLKEGELYRVSLDKTGLGEFSIRDENNTSALLYVENEEGHVSRTFTYKKGATLRIGNRQIVNSELSFANIQIEHASTETAYESYKSSILSCNNDVTLRGIGDVKDTLDLMTGEYVQHIGEVVFDGSEDWYNTSKETDNYIMFRSSEFSAKFIPPICDRFKTYSTHMPNINEENGELLNLQTDNNCFQFIIKKEKLSSNNVEGFKQWLSQNPTTVQYRLATSTIKTVDSNVVDQDGNIIPKIKSYDGVTHFEVTVPKQSLLPNVSAEVATDNSKDMSSLTTKHQEISEAQATIQDNIQSQSDEIDTALMATTEIFESILQ